MSERRRRFSEEFKREAVRLAFEGSRPVSEVARELDVRPNMLRRWGRKLSGDGGGPSEAERRGTEGVPEISEGDCCPRTVKEAYGW